MTRYRPARHYVWFCVAAALLAGGCVWLGWKFSLVIPYLAAGLFALTAAALFVLVRRPTIEIHDTYLAIGKRVVPWIDIRRVDRLGGICPLLVRLTLFDDSRFVLIFPGDLDSCPRLLRTLRRSSRDARIDGVPYRQYWGEVASTGDRKQPAAPRYRVLRPEDEAEVEWLYQRLKTVGNLDQKNSSDET